MRKKNNNSNDVTKLVVHSRINMQIPNSSAVERTAVNRQVDGSTPSWGDYLSSLICILPCLSTNF